VSIGTDIAWFREAQERLFTTQAKTTRAPEAGGAFDPATGLYGAVQPLLVHEGACLIRWGLSAQGGSTREVRTGEREVLLEGYRGKWPANTPIQRGDMVEVLADEFDEGLVGMTFRVAAVARDAWQIARVCELEEVSG
jgi:hypothetical protein